jgi:tRNA(Ile)-lysidine synthase TilS/MesJ
LDLTMQCSTCKREAVIFQPYSGRHLCRDHIILDVEAKAKRAIRVHHGIQPGDHIAVAQTGDSASRALLVFLHKLTGKRRDVRVSGIAVKEGLEYCDIRGMGITKIAVATTLEDAASSALTEILRGNVETFFKHDSTTVCKFPQISPFSHIPAEEIAMYAQVCNAGEEMQEEGTGNDPLRDEVKEILADYSSRHPAAPHAILNLCESLTCVKKECRKEAHNDS